MRSPSALGATCIALAIGLGSPAAYAQWVTTNGPAGTSTKAFNTTPTSLFAATGAGIFFTSNYTSWTATNSGLTNTNLSAVVRSAHQPSALLVGTVGSAGVFQSWNNGASWWASNTGLSNPTVRAMISVPDNYVGTVYLLGTDTGVFRSQAAGTNWWSVNTGLTNTAIRAFTSYFEGSDENDGLGANNVLAGTNGGGVFLTDTGTSWTPKNTGLTNLFVNALASSSSYATTFAGTAGGGVFRSTSIGGGWTAINSGLTNLTVKSMAASGTKIFAGTAGGGVFVAGNDGSSGWSVVNTGLTNLTVDVLATDGTNLFAATGAGVFRRPLAQM